MTLATILAAEIEADLAWNALQSKQLSQKIQQNLKVSHFLTILDKRYPSQLQEIYSPPVVLFYQGDLTTRNSFLRSRLHKCSFNKKNSNSFMKNTSRYINTQKVGIYLLKYLTTGSNVLRWIGVTHFRTSRCGSRWDSRK